jgi:GR25 family glycosyltransferase involved in LPS biosynthesis
VIVDLINLDRFEERRQEFFRNNKHLTEVRRCSNWDARDIDFGALVDNGTIHKEIMQTYSPGALATALCHISLWDRAITTGTVITVCEDDAIFHNQFEREAQAIIDRLPENWDVLLYGWNFDSMLLIDMLPGSPGIVLCDEDRLREHAEEFQRHSQSPQPFRVLQHFGLLCYSLSPRGAKTLKDFCLPFRPMSIAMPGLTRNLQSNRQLANVGLDVVMSAAYPQLNAFVTLPPLAISKNDHARSTIQNMSPISTMPTLEVGNAR